MWLAYALDTIFLFYCGGILWAYAKRPLKRYDTLYRDGTLNFADELQDDDMISQEDDGFQGIGG